MDAKIRQGERKMAAMRRQAAKGFTLVELLVVIAIIGILAGLMAPALGKARGYAQSAVCRSNLRDIGTAFQSYVGDYKGYMPFVAAMPSLKLNSYPGIVEVMEPYANSRKVFKCPSDRGASTPGAVTDTTDEDGAAATTSSSAQAVSKSDFENEGSSYEFNEFLCGRKIKLLSWAVLMHDYRTYHGQPGAPGASNYLFEDGHVGDMN